VGGWDVAMRRSLEWFGK